MSSASEFGKDIGVIHEVVVTGRKLGVTAKDWGVLAHNEDKFRQVLAVIRGQTEIKSFEYVIDCNEKPHIPNGWEIRPGDQLKNRVTGQFKWDPDKVSLYLSKKQGPGKYIQGHELRKELERKPVMNANVLDYLLANQELIPEDWKGKHVYFWGTVYSSRSRLGGLGVRCLYWNGGRWRWDFGWLGLDWYNWDTAAVAS